MSAMAPEEFALSKVVVLGRLTGCCGPLANELAARRTSKKLRSCIVYLLEWSGYVVLVCILTSPCARTTCEVDEMFAFALLSTGSIIGTVLPDLYAWAGAST